MGTNYYAKIIPPTDKVEELIHKIRSDDTLHGVSDAFEKLFGDYRFEGNEEFGNVIHLGKASGGWKFLWNPNAYIVRSGHWDGHTYIPNPNKLHFLYKLTKQGISDFVNRPDVEIFDEYGKKQDKQKFLDTSFNSTGFDDKTYEEKYGESYGYYYRSEMTNLLIESGVKFNNTSCSEFYSDGLRFSSTTEFS